MSTTAKTILYVVIAAALVAAAYLTIPGIPDPEMFLDEGQPFFDKFTDPDQAAALEVVSWDDKTAIAKPFRVQRKNGRWTIPSHHDYPADATDQMAKAASLLIGLDKSSVRSDDPADQKAFGVLDPTDPAADTDGRGTLVKFEDASGNPVAELIIGKAVEGHADQRYVRYPGKKRTYVANLDNVPDTKFSEWIDTELMDAPSYEIEELIFDLYSIDEMTGTQVPGELLAASKKDFKWTIGDLGEDEEVDETKLRDVATAVSGLKIVGVREKPAGLSRDLKGSEGIKLNQATAFNLQAHGFFVGQGSLLANEGELIVKTKKGVDYNLRFGEVIYGEGDDVTAGAAGEGEKAETPDKPEGDGEDSKALKANRYLMITAHFDDAYLGKPAQAALPQAELDKRQKARDLIQTVTSAIDQYKTKHEGKLPDTLVQLTEGDEPQLDAIEKDPWGNDLVLATEGDDAPVAVVTSLGADGQPGGERENSDVASNDLQNEDDWKKLADDWKAFEKKAEDGKALAQKMTERFAPWYYVIDDESFKKLRLTRADVVKVKEADDEEGEDDEG